MPKNMRERFERLSRSTVQGKNKAIPKNFFRVVHDMPVDVLRKQAKLVSTHMHSRTINKNHMNPRQVFLMRNIILVNKMLQGIFKDDFNDAKVALLDPRNINKLSSIINVFKKNMNGEYRGYSKAFRFITSFTLKEISKRKPEDVYTENDHKSPLQDVRLKVLIMSLHKINFEEHNIHKTNISVEELIEKYKVALPSEEDFEKIIDVHNEIDNLRVVKESTHKKLTKIHRYNMNPDTLEPYTIQEQFEGIVDQLDGYQEGGILEEKQSFTKEDYIQYMKNAVDVNCNKLKKPENSSWLNEFAENLRSFEYARLGISVGGSKIILEEKNILPFLVLNFEEVINEEIKLGTKETKEQIKASLEHLSKMVGHTLHFLIHFTESIKTMAKEQKEINEAIKLFMKDKRFNNSTRTRKLRNLGK
jgi:hypothetical protein